VKTWLSVLKYGACVATIVIGGVALLDYCERHHQFPIRIVVKQEPKPGTISWKDWNDGYTAGKRAGEAPKDPAEEFETVDWSQVYASEPSDRLNALDFTDIHG